jgi:chromate transport protein ChrA
MLALGLLLWFAKDVTDANLQKGMAIGLLVGAVAGLVITVIGTTSGILRTNGWLAIVVYGLFGLVYAYLVFLKPKSQAI